MHIYFYSYERRQELFHGEGTHGAGSLGISHHDPSSTVLGGFGRRHLLNIRVTERSGEKETNKHIQKPGTNNLSCLLSDPGFKVANNARGGSQGGDTLGHKI